ncbi:hypothetical protein SAMN02746065_10859 [Desulfocicer vacuolatum DSM 3385]|uniref:Uncharacterized protein n=1 Tax=Desulfocicer vacuolatum DSM 3385 TaxID=1121400 RepID=A0A1W2BFC9_9BACT|nr:hypothetical protein SAMN02746065_10859 [Desulfocicer vacuolatum DSM 3385]
MRSARGGYMKYSTNKGGISSFFVAEPDQNKDWRGDYAWVIASFSSIFASPVLRV